MYYFIESEYYKNIHIYDGNKSSLLCGKESPKDLQDSDLKLFKSRKACLRFICNSVFSKDQNFQGMNQEDFCGVCISHLFGDNI